MCAKGLGVVEAVPSHEVSLSERVLVRDAFQLRLKGSRINRGISRLPSCGRPTKAIRPALPLTRGRELSAGH